MYKYKNTEKKLCKSTDVLLNKCKNSMIVSVRPSSDLIKSTVIAR